MDLQGTYLKMNLINKFTLKQSDPCFTYQIENELFLLLLLYFNRIKLLECW